MRTEGVATVDGWPILISRLGRTRRTAGPASAASSGRGHLTCCSAPFADDPMLSAAHPESAITLTRGAAAAASRRRLRLQRATRSATNRPGPAAAPKCGA